MADVKVFPGAHGLPTGPETKRLLDRYGLPIAGLLILHEEIAATIGVPYKSQRYKSITESWRSQLRKDHDLMLRAIPGEGFLVLTEREKIEESEGHVKKSVRQARIAASDIRMVHTEQLDEEGRKRAMHVQELTFRLYDQGLAATKALRPPAPPKQLPRG